MEQYKDWQEGDNNLHAKCPIHNIIVSPMINQNSTNYGANRIISSNYTRPSPQIYSPQRQIIQSSNQNISNNYYNYNYNQYSNQNQQQYNNKINNNIQNYNQMNYNYKNDYKNKPTNLNINSDKFINYESSDGVIRGYTNNYSFYVSGSSKIKPKVTINNIPIEYNNSNINYMNTNQRKYEYQNSNSFQNNIGYNQNGINVNNNNQIINQNNNSSYIIRVIEKEPTLYNPPNEQYNNNYENKNAYNINNKGNRFFEERIYQQPDIQRIIIKENIEREPNNSRKGYYKIEPKDNLRNVKNNPIIYINNSNIHQQPIPTIQKVNNEEIKNSYSNRLNQRYENINQKNDYFNSNPTFRRNNTPIMQRPNTTSYINYSNPEIYKQQRRIIEPNFSENNIGNLSYNERFPYQIYTKQNDFPYIRTESISPSYRSTFINYSPNINNRYIYPKQNRQREFTTRTEFHNQGDLEYENDEDENEYEVPLKYNKNNNIVDREYYEERSQNNFSEKPFTRINNYSQTRRNGRKYGVYTQTLAMNKNYSHNNEYEVELPRNISSNNLRPNYSYPKIMKPINDVQRLLKNKKEYSAFENSLRNIRNNEEEIELENKERNNRVRNKTTGINNQSLYSSNNSNDRNRKYRTSTEKEDYRTQGKRYILQDIDDDNNEDYDIYQNQNYSNENMNRYNNYRVAQNIKNERILNRRQPIQQYYQDENDYYEEEQIETNLNKNNNQNRNMNINNLNNEEEEMEDEEEEEVEQMYDSSQLIKSKESNFGIVNNNFNILNKQENEGEKLEEKEEDEIPKNVKNIETEINEKYYDNQGNYLGEKKIITTKKVPIDYKEEEFISQQNNGEYYEEKERNEDEYEPYQSSNKKFKKRGGNIAIRRIQQKNLNKNENNYKESKYQSYLGNSNDNVNYKIEGINGEKQEESGNEEEIEDNNRERVTFAKNATFEIQSENLYVKAGDNEKEKNQKKSINNEEKEADEQQIENHQGEDNEDDEEKNNMNENYNDGNSNLQIEQNMNENLYENKNENIDENEDKNEITNENKNVEYENNQNDEEEDNNSNNKEDNNVETNSNNYEENNIINYEDNNNYYNNEENEYNDEENNQIEENTNINKENIDMNQNNYDEMNENDEENEYNNDNENENNEEEQMIEENEGEAIEDQNIQKDEEEEEDNAEEMVDIEGNNDYNYHKEYEENENIEGEEQDGEEHIGEEQEGEEQYGEEQEGEEQDGEEQDGEEQEGEEIGDYNVIEEENVNKEEVEENGEEN